MGYTYHIERRDRYLNYALELVFEGLIWENRIDQINLRLKATITMRNAKHSP